MYIRPREGDTLVYISNDNGIRRIIEREGEQYRLTISEDRECFMVENLTFTSSCAMSIFDLDAVTREHLRVANWEFFLDNLVQMNYII